MKELSFDFRYPSEGLLAVDYKFNIINANVNAETLLGVSLLGKNFLDYVDERYHSLLIKRVRTLLSGTIKDFKVKVHLKALEKNIEIYGFAAGDAAVIRLVDINYLESINNILNIISNSMENILEMIMITDSKGKIIYVNPAFTKITGYSLKEVSGKTPNILKSGEQDKKFYEVLWRTILSGEIWHGEIINKKKNGEFYYEEMTIVPIKGENNEIKYFVALKYDITEIKIREKKLERNNEIFSTLYNISLELGGFPDLREMYEKIYKELKKVLNFAWLLLAIYHEEKNEIFFPFVMSNFEKVNGFTIKCDPEKSLVARVIKTKKPLLIRDVLKEFPPTSYKVIGSDVERDIERSALFVPIIYRDKVLGVIDISTPLPNAYTEEDLKYLSIIANSLAIFIENYNLYRRIEETKEMYETLINTSLVGIGITDTSNRLTFVNDTLAKMLGYSTHELVGKNIFELAESQNAKKIREGVMRRSQGFSDSYETRVIRKDGKVINVLINASPLRDKNGNLIGTMGILVDITERKKWENRLKEEWEKYKTIMENILVGIVMVYDGKVIFLNSAVKEILGYSEEIVGDSFLKFIHPDMREIVWENYQKRMSGSYVPDYYMVKLVDSKGVTKWGILRGAVVDWEGKKVDMVSIQDITLLKEMEEKLLAMVNAFEEIKLARNEEDVYKLAIESISSILKFNHVAIVQVSESGIVPRRWRGMGSSRMLPVSNEKGIVAWVARNQKSYYAPNVLEDENYLMVNPVTKSEYATPISTKGRMFGVLNIESDKIDGISPDDRMLVDLIASHIAVALAGLEYQRKLEKAKNLQELMLHIVSHDLKNPLAVLQGYLDLIREEPMPEFFDSMEDALGEAENIIDKAKLFSKLGSDKIDLERKRVSVLKILQESIGLIRKKYLNVKILNFMDSFEIEGFEILKEAFINILDNAFKYGATEVKISSTEVNGVLEIRFADNGPGIPEEKKEIIFKPFERFSSGKGSGLGLSIVKMILQLHGGDVKVENNIPKGSVFVLRIPRNF